MEDRKLYDDIALRTQGDIYIGVVGPVRTGKSTFIKRFMETLVIPGIDNVYRRERARDELPQSGSGRTIMTAEPKFVPEEAVSVTVDGSSAFQVRLIDCVGYMVAGAVGQMEGDNDRMVTTPWFEHEIPLTEAAEIGTRKVIAEHSTVGIVVTTDGSITDIPREDYLEPEKRAILELKEQGKPFLVLLNCTDPTSARAQAIRTDIEQRYSITCLAVNCLELELDSINAILRDLLYEFPVRQMELYMPAWIDALYSEHPIKQNIYAAIRSGTQELRRIRDVEGCVRDFSNCPELSDARIRAIDLGTGIAQAELDLPRELFYDTLSQQSGFQIGDDGDLMALLTELSGIKSAYDKVSDALKQVEETGYGIVVPDITSLNLEEPEITKQGGRYGVRLKASAPSIHMIRADIETEVSPIVGGEKQSEDMIRYLLQEYEGDSKKIWQANIFGKSLHELVSEDLNTKLRRMPDDARLKLRETLQRIINEGSGGLICIIL